MNDKTKRVLYWTPRILTIAFALFVSLFALDVFSEVGGFAHKAIDLLMHLIPTALLLLALAIAWRREWVGAIVFPLLAARHASMIWGRFDWTVYALIEAPLVLIGILFWLNWRLLRNSKLGDKPSNTVLTSH